MEFGAYCEAIVPALFGGLTFCLMAIYSYITIATPEEDRVFRFGIFAMFVTGVPFIGQPISGVLFTTLGYTCELNYYTKKNGIILMRCIPLWSRVLCLRHCLSADCDILHNFLHKRGEDHAHHQHHCE